MFVCVYISRVYSNKHQMPLSLQPPPPSLEPLPTVAIWSIGSTGGNVGEHAFFEALVDRLDRCLQPELSGR